MEQRAVIVLLISGLCTLCSCLSHQAGPALGEQEGSERSTAHVWMGLRFSCAMKFWLWLDGEITWYQNWAPGNDTGSVGTGGSRIWSRATVGQPAQD
ncbi:hypothetical protein AAFF_G00371960 [Aldrovandia affinis]|uniref:C-type lectin domain-containing protein n=1 Tax=Aldrovandia affinis TaxID=143900 RepID=A0AAD7R4X4_9TELE|nr:hypothetical protein AAFF_G00371960 [Aldrovandia affinis]